MAIERFRATPHTNFPPEVDGQLPQYQRFVSKRVDLQLATEQAFGTIERILNSASGQQAVNILPSIQRVFALRRTDIDNVMSQESEFRQKCLEDILFDVHSYSSYNNSQLIRVDAAGILETLQIIQQIEVAFYDVAQIKSKILPYYSRRNDVSWEEFVAHTVVRNVIWKRWQPWTMNLADRAHRTYQLVMGNLRHLEHQSLRDASTSDGILLFSTDMQWGKKSRPGHTLEQVLLNREEPQQHELDSAEVLRPVSNDRFSHKFILDELYRITSSFSLEEITAAINQLDVRQKKAILRTLGYYLNELSQDAYYKKTVTKRMTFHDELWRAVRALRDILPEITTHSTAQSTDLAVIISELDGRVVYRLNKRVLHFDSPRIYLVESKCLEDTKFVQKLTDSEQEILRLALYLNRDTFVYDNAQISAQLKSTQKYVENVLTKALRIHKSGENRFINTANDVIRKGSSQALLIEISQRIEPIQTANLSDFQFQMFTMLTTQNDQGRYQTIAHISNDNRVGGDTLERIFRALGSTDQLETLRGQLEVAQEHKELFTENQQKMIEHFLRCLRNGVPIIGANGGIGFEAAANLLGLSAGTIAEFLKESLPNRLNASLETEHEKITARPTVGIKNDHDLDSTEISAVDAIQSERVARYAEDFTSFDLAKLLSSERYVDAVDAVKLAWGEMMALPLLTREEALDLVKIWHAEREQWARAKLLHHNIRLVLYLARRYQGRGLPLLDLVQEGAIGLFHALDLFDPDRGAAFTTYATYWIRQTLHRAILNVGSTIRLPSNTHDKIQQLRIALEHFKATNIQINLDVASDLGTVAKHLQWSVKTLKRIRDARFLLTLDELDAPIRPDEEGELGAFIADTTSPDPEILTSFANMSTIIREAINTIANERIRLILKIRYGFMDGESYTLEEVGKMYALSRERIRQLEKLGLEMLAQNKELKELSQTFAE